MSSTLIDELLEHARVLSQEERAHLAYMLLHDDEETEDAWWASIGPELDARWRRWSRAKWARLRWRKSSAGCVVRRAEFARRRAILTNI